MDDFLPGYGTKLKGHTFITWKSNEEKTAGKKISEKGLQARDETKDFTKGNVNGPAHTRW